MKEEKIDWIFYLKLSPHLTEKYFALEAEFKARGYTLIPVSFSDLIPLIQSEGQLNVITIADSITEAKYFHKKIRKVLKYLLRSERVLLHLASSFELLDDTYAFGASGGYHFTKLPISLLSYCDSIENTVKIRKMQANKWPGASRRLGSTIR